MPLTIVVIDDSEEYRLIVRGLLRSVHDVTTFVGDAASGADGLALVRRERPDMVITDLVMPGLDGIELARRIRLKLPKTKIILMSAVLTSKTPTGTWLPTAARMPL